jgi:hypothetical protein
VGGVKVHMRQLVLRTSEQLVRAQPSEMIHVQENYTEFHQARDPLLQLSTTDLDELGNCELESLELGVEPGFLQVEGDLDLLDSVANAGGGTQPPVEASTVVSTQPAPVQIPEIYGDPELITPKNDCFQPSDVLTSISLKPFLSPNEEKAIRFEPQFPGNLAIISSVLDGVHTQTDVGATGGRVDSDAWLDTTELTSEEEGFPDDKWMVKSVKFRSIAVGKSMTTL